MEKRNLRYPTESFVKLALSMTKGTGGMGTPPRALEPGHWINQHMA